MTMNDFILRKFPAIPKQRVIMDTFLRRTADTGSALNYLTRRTLQLLRPDVRGHWGADWAGDIIIV